MKVGDLVRGSKDNIEAQQKSIALVVERETDGRFTILWLAGTIKSRRSRSGFRPEELEVISEGR